MREAFSRVYVKKIRISLIQSTQYKELCSFNVTYFAKWFEKPVHFIYPDSRQSCDKIAA